MKTIEIYWDDLKPEKQKELLRVIGDNGNYDIFPIFILELEDDENGI